MVLAGPRPYALALYYILIKDVGYIQRIPATTDILVSAWAERGWTYQEALLSQARLYFTDQQVYYEDEESVKCEVNTLVGVEEPDICEWGSFPIHSRMAWSDKSGDVYKCIQEFSNRVLSFPSDAVDALQGVFATFEQDFQMRQICGMAYETRLPLEIPLLCYSLLFETNHTSTRCDVFPSWSWAGWTGGKWWPFGYHIDRSGNISGFDDTVLEVAVELAPGHTISWREFQNRYDALRLQSVSSIKFLHIQAYLVPLLGWTRYCNNDVPEGSANLQDGLRFHTSLLFGWKHIADMEDIEECALLNFHIPRCWSVNSNPLHLPKISHLLVRKKGTFWERITQVKGLYICCKDEHIGLRCWSGVVQTIRLG